MVRRTVLLVGAALALGLCASASGKISPVLTVGQSRTFSAGQLVPDEPVTCIWGGNRLTTTVPSLLPADAWQATEEGHWAILRTHAGLALSILIELDDSYVVTCSRAPTTSSPILIPGGARRP